ncbi:hypothetical protein A9404_09080 [Halothiobacillus diazotrophicus]|uniref:Uncharacterized protein n=1 Tax=Halothiobacillus diazotrophicus TaxID=1860122 RepID=A0A191ZI00_9GAMM|nr:hypothetical protein [Halothiobacillus diazotrophicus]ANJ67521.1 hypothetical protein A9404_09080 [Halothiobacillus diazotrophicus]
MTVAKEPPANDLTPEDISSIIHEFGRDRRDDHQVRAVYLQPLNAFGPPNVGVLTHEDALSITIASVPLDAPDGSVVVYDDECPEGPRSLYGIIETVRAASRATDHIQNMRLIYIHKQDGSSIA